MSPDDSKRSSRHKHRHDKDNREHKSKRKHKSDKESSSRKRSRKDTEDHLHVVDDDVNDEDMWVEKNIDMDGEVVRMFCYVLSRRRCNASGRVGSRSRRIFRQPRTSS